MSGEVSTTADNSAIFMCTSAATKNAVESPSNNARHSTAGEKAVTRLRNPENTISGISSRATEKTPRRKITSPNGRSRATVFTMVSLAV